ncbi:MAG: hypothetical protein M9886_10425 [Candidatus Nanopelagicales bacterium]|nr:hypothetical protein [Candidatus Nanopelagicales bacterium]
MTDPNSQFFGVHGLAAMGAPDPSTEYQIPDLAGLFDKNILNLALDALFGTWRGPKEHPHNRIWLNMVRLSDQAVREYQAARVALGAYGAKGHQGHLSPYYLAIDHFENAVSAVHRATWDADTLNGVGEWSLSLPSQGVRDNVADVRNAVEHIDERLKRGSVEPGIPIYLHPLPEFLQIDRHQLTYADLADCVTIAYQNLERVRGSRSW